MRDWCSWRRLGNQVFIEDIQNNFIRKCICIWESKGGIESKRYVGVHIKIEESSGIRDCGDTMDHFYFLFRFIVHMHLVTFSGKSSGYVVPKFTPFYFRHLELWFFHLHNRPNTIYSFLLQLLGQNAIIKGNMIWCT